jgi:hypothetical protein
MYFFSRGRATPELILTHDGSKDAALCKKAHFEVKNDKFQLFGGVLPKKHSQNCPWIGIHRQTETL